MGTGNKCQRPPRHKLSREATGLHTHTGNNVRGLGGNNGTEQRVGEIPSGRLEECSYPLCVSLQVAQLQVEMGASEWALKPELARQEYRDVGPCVFQLLLSP